MSVPEVASLLDKDEELGDTANIVLVMEKLPEEKRIEIIMQRMRNKSTPIAETPAAITSPILPLSDAESSSDSESSDDEGLGKRKS
jgi:hypothetical protein